MSATWHFAFDDSQLFLSMAIISHSYLLQSPHPWDAFNEGCGLSESRRKVQHALPTGERRSHRVGIMFGPAGVGAAEHCLEVACSPSNAGQAAIP